MKRNFLIGIMIFLCLTFGIQSLSQGENMIYGCYKKENGQLRVVTDHNQCLDSESPILLYGEPTVQHEFTVHCAAGETIADALAQAPPYGHVTITIEGVCQEKVRIHRDNVTLRGASPGDGMQGSAGVDDDWVLSVCQARGIILEQLTLTPHPDTWVGLELTQGAYVSAKNLHITGHKYGVTVGRNSYGFISGSTIEDCKFSCLSASENGGVKFYSGLIRNSLLWGVTSSSGGIVRLGGDEEGDDVFVRNNNIGAFVTDGGLIQLQKVIVENNAGDGVVVKGGSNLAIDWSIIQGNSGHGISLSDTSVALGGQNQIINNGGYGITCAPPSQIGGNTGTVSGNTLGQINCP